VPETETDRTNWVTTHVTLSANIHTPPEISREDAAEEAVGRLESGNGYVAGSYVTDIIWEHADRD
jgi:hypothetical protein